MTAPATDMTLRRLGDLVLPRVGRVHTGGPDAIPSSALLLPDPLATRACTEFLLSVHSRHRPATVRSYAYALQRWFRFLSAVGTTWDQAVPADARDFIIWMKHAKKTGGAKRPTTRDPRQSRNAVTGKAYLDEAYRAGTINHNETVLHEFYEFHLRSSSLLMNPFMRNGPDSARNNAHHNPLRQYSRQGRGGVRQREAKRLPRSMPDDAYDDFFAVMRSDRDRALVAIYSSSGARPSEVLGMNGEDISLPDGLITVERKGGVSVQTLPVSADAVTWFRLYQESVGVALTGEPLWVTLRGPRRRLTYDALRAMFSRANAALGTNWTPHDLRHTAATRMLQSGHAPRLVQEVLGHATLDTLAVYSVPRLEDMIAAVRSTAARSDPVLARPSAAPAYDPSDMGILFGVET